MSGSETTLQQKVIVAEQYLAENYPNLFLVVVFIQMLCKAVFSAFEMDVEYDEAYWTIVVMWCIASALITIYVFIVVGNAVSLWSSYGFVVPIIWLTCLIATAVIGRLKRRRRN